MTVGCADPPAEPHRVAPPIGDRRTAPLPADVLHALTRGEPWQRIPARTLLAGAAAIVLSRIEGTARVPVVFEFQRDAASGTAHDRATGITVEGRDSAMQWFSRLDATLQAAPGQADDVLPATVQPLDVSIPARSDVAPGPVAAGRLRIRLEGSCVVGEVEAASPYVDMGTRFAGCVARVLERIARDPGCTVSAAFELTDPERRALLDLARPSDWHWSGPVDVVGVFARQVAAMPDAPAIEWDGGAQTYAELQDQARVVASRLAAQGVAPGAVVGLAIDRSADAIRSILGILHAGAAYLPLDPRLPAERIAYMLEQAGAAVTLVGADGSGNVPPGTRRLSVAALLAPHGRDPVPPAPEIDPDLPAYVMFTSGSTGRPKGVVIRHRSIVRLVVASEVLHFDRSTRMLQIGSLGFDASTYEIWGALLNGGVCIVHPEAVPTAAGIGRTISERSANTALITTALFNAVVDVDPGHLRGLRHVLVGGEAMSSAHVARALDAVPGLVVLNGYGPTETTTLTTAYTVVRDRLAPGRSVPIGRPVTRTTSRVLNAKLELVPEGFVGELCSGGDGLAAGYIGRPDLTAERFVQDPFGAPGDLLYRSGDLVRLLPDGNLDYVGRRDGQLKIRGFRIEPGEIESALTALPTVRTCAVLARSTGTGPRLVAYVVPADGAAFDVHEARRTLGESLPAYMVPSDVVLLDALPLTINGKLDRAALPSPPSGRPELRQPFIEPDDPVEQRLADMIGRSLGIDRVGALDNFFELGGNSLAVLALLARRSTVAGWSLPVARFFVDPTPRGLASEIRAAGNAPAPAPRAPAGASTRGVENEPIAIVGMALRVPGALDVEAFWRNLCDGIESITRFAREDIDPSVSPARLDDPAYVTARGIIEGVDRFDAAFFGISPLEADLMDPQQRVFLELCWECMERAGHVPGSEDASVGVFAGVYNATYLQHHVGAHPELVERLGELQVLLANEKDFVATRTAHRLDLTGPAVSVFTACSTSLVAVAQAVDALRAGRCDLALAGGAAITCPPNSGYMYQEGGMLSPDGRTRTFSSDARGTVFSDGAAVVLLRRLSDALADGDTIHAVVSGIAINNDGARKSSFTGPSINGQAAVITAALQASGLGADDIDYVEAHGTATPLGDPVEIEALARAFRRWTARRGYCLIGSVKSNIGHTVMAAGAAGLIKAALSLEREHIPPTIGVDAQNPNIDFDASPFVVARQGTAWPRGERVRAAGVSSFGVGGTNAHAIVREAPARAPREPQTGPFVLRLSARTQAALERSVERLATHLEANPALDLVDVAHTLNVGRKRFPCRAAVVAHDLAEAAAALRDEQSPARVRGETGPATPTVALLLSGQGSQYAGMGSALHRSEPAFARAIEECLDALDGALEVDLRSILLGPDGSALERTEVLQPALFCVEYALARLWMSRGIEPAALLGHSVGEFVAAAVAGTMRVYDAARLVARRGALMQSMAPGRMLAVRMPPAALRKALPADLSVAAVNAPGACVVAGPTDAIATFERMLLAQGVQARALATSHAFHSSMMDEAIAPFIAAVSAVELSAPRIPIVSSVTGTWLSDAQAVSPEYWGRHLRDTVDFSGAVRTLLGTAGRVFLECGPRAALAGFVRQHAGSNGSAPIAVATMGDSAADEALSLARAVARLWTCGVETNSGAYPGRRRIPLPTYPFERRRHWVDTRPGGIGAPGSLQHASAGTPEPAAPLAPVAPAALLPTPEIEPGLAAQDGIEALLQQQIALMEQQLALLAAAAAADGVPTDTVEDTRLVSTADGSSSPTAGRAA
ncbi:MAG: amino acid adenylation domain-containing protein [Burkholderiales bacterium]